MMTLSIKRRSSMKYLKADMDRKLLLLIAISALFLIIFTIYYKVKVQSLISDLREKKDEVQQNASKILMDELNKTARIKETAIKDKLSIEKKYNELQMQNINLQNDIISSKETVASLCTKLHSYGYSDEQCQ